MMTLALSAFLSSAPLEALAPWALLEASCERVRRAARPRVTYAGETHDEYAEAPEMLTREPAQPATYAQEVHHG